MPARPTPPSAVAVHWPLLQARGDGRRESATHLGYCVRGCVWRTLCGRSISCPVPGSAADGAACATCYRRSARAVSTC